MKDLDERIAGCRPVRCRREAQLDVAYRSRLERPDHDVAANASERQLRQQRKSLARRHERLDRMKVERVVPRFEARLEALMLAEASQIGASRRAAIRVTEDHLVGKFVERHPVVDGEPMTRRNRDQERILDSSS